VLHNLVGRSVAGDNSLFKAAHAFAKVVDPIATARIEEDGTIHELNIINTNGFTKDFLEPGDQCFFIIMPVHKCGEKNSVLEISIDNIYKLRLQCEHTNLNTVSASSSASTTPVKSPQPTQPTERAPKVTKINFD
jgi:hypothetical protein